MAKKRRIHIVIAILIVWTVFFITDFSLAKANKSPVFTIPLIRYKDGGSTEYYGLGYKVIKYVNFTVDKDLKIKDVDFGTWLMRFSDTLSFPRNDGEIIKDPTEFVWDRRPMVMLKGELYLDTGHESDIDGRCGVMDGEISSTVDGSEIPTQDNQSNFGDGYEYQYVDRNSVDIYMNGKWIRFEKETIDDLSIQLNFTEKDLLNIELPFLHIGDVKEILGVHYINEIKQTFYIPMSVADEDSGLNTYSYITINDKDYYLGSSLDKYEEYGFQRFNLIKSYIGDEVLEFREVLGANSIVTKYIGIYQAKPIMIANLSGDLFSKDIDGDGIVESIGTVGTSPETTIYNWDLNNNKVYFVNLNEATDSLAVLYEQNENQFKVFKDNFEFIYEYCEKRLNLID